MDTKEIARALHRQLNPESSAPIIACSKSGKIGAVEIKSELGGHQKSHALPAANCWLFSVGLNHRGFSNEIPVEGAEAPTSTHILIFDLAHRPRMTIQSVHALKFVLSREALDEAADSLQAAPIGDLSIDANTTIEDETIRRLAFLLLPELSQGGRNQSLFVDHLLRAFAVHVALSYAGVVPGSQQRRGGLATWQLRRAQEILRTNMDGSIGLEQVAESCRLSVSHFSRAFRQSTGMAPYTWLRKHRIEAAKSLLRGQTNSLSDIAIACGFSDQSHFTRVFHQEVGASPGAWRKCVSAAA